VSDLLEQHFDTAFAAPDGIAKLRELILTLAMQGKLVEQDVNDPPASELLREIEKERASHEGTKTRRKEKLPPIKPEEVPYELPQGWKWVRLGDIVLSITGGGTPSKNNPSFWGGDIPWASVKDLNVETYLDSTIDSITEKAIGSSSTNLIPKGSIIVCTRMGLGKIAINRVAVAINQDLKALTVSSHVDQMFFFKKYKNYKITGSGMTVHGIRQEELLNFLFPLPPLPEQHRIVARIDQLMARCDALEKLRKEREEKRLAVHAAAIKQLLDAPNGSAWEFIEQHFGALYTVKENVAELRKAILQLAVMGRLVEQDPNDPPASELLKEIEKERASHEGTKARRGKGGKELPEIKPEEVPYALPKGWEWVRLGDVSTKIHYGYTASADHRIQDVRLLRITDIQDNKVDWDTVPGCNAKKEDVGQYLLADKDILIARTGGTVGKSYLVQDINVDAVFASYLIRVVPSRCIDVRFIKYFAEGPLYWRQLYAACSGTGQPNVNGTSLSQLLFALPPLPEQHRIVARIDQLMALCDTLDQQIDAATGKQSELLNAVMAQV
jgi:type I restriction enzyme S subunit